MVEDGGSIVHTTTPAGRGTATSHASQVDGGWLSVQAQETIANLRVHRSFDEARDPLLAKQLDDADQNKSESQRRGESETGGPKKRQRENPQGGSSGWLKAQAAQALASAQRQVSQRTTRQRALSGDRPTPHAPYHGPSL